MIMCYYGTICYVDWIRMELDAGLSIDVLSLSLSLLLSFSLSLQVLASC